MADLDELKIPKATRAMAEAVIVLTDHLIPYIPAVGRDGTAEWLTQIRDA